eukprot:TRINITY_DN112815_c0_g1_i1.p1 TRINITY_DN112815_c0_g1~~TRINITY_DN112815_c0_g1_i1.p1  ORF type:complete len:285 (+),score=35.74 TRINITY_DN112815_c0_g1_i1:103-957(+)
MASIQKSASTGSLANAGAHTLGYGAHIPKRATQHGVFLSSWEVLPTTLKPTQKTLERHVYSEEAKPLKETYLQEQMAPTSVYKKYVSQKTLPEHYKEPRQPVRQKEPDKSTVGHRGTGHWSSTYRSTHDDASVEGALYHRQTGPSYQAANPPTCVGGGGSKSSYQEDYGLNGSDPRQKLDPNSERIPVIKSELTYGTFKGTLHIPGYNGCLPRNTRNPYCARVESGATHRTNDKTNLTQQFHVNTLNYSGHIPVEVANDFGPRRPDNLTTMGKTYQAHSLKAFG